MAEYTPFKMKAHGSTPMKKNFGIGDSEMAIKTDSPGKAKSPFFKGGRNVFQKARDAVKRLKEKKAAPAQDQAAEATQMAEAQAMEAQEAGAAGGEGAVAPHGPEAHTGGAGPQGVGGGLSKVLGKVRAKAPGTGERGMMGGLFSDVRLKEKIEKTGASPSGIPIYEFNYIGCSNRYSGAMAQDLLGINPDAVSLDSSGYYKVNYNDIDVDMHLINN